MSTSEEERLAALRAEYERLCHAMQSGVGYSLVREPSGGTPKHLRVGLNTAHVGQGALAELLIRKGLLSRVELYEELVAFMRREVESYERELGAAYGTKVTLL